MARVLVTGAGGFIGTNLVGHLSANGHEVYGIVHQKQEQRQPGASYIECDISNLKAVRQAFQEVRPEWVFNLAASNIQSGVSADIDILLGTNVLGTQNLLVAAREMGVHAFIHTGSFLEYGAKSEPCKEDMRCDPPEPYSISKLAGTLLVQTSAVPAVVFRLFTPYGPGMQKGRVVRELIERAQHGTNFNLTAPSVARDYIYINDVVMLLVEAATRIEKHQGEIYNMGSGRMVTLEELSRLVVSILESRSIPEWGSASPVAYDSDIWRADMTKTFAAFDWRPSVTLEEGIRHTATWLEDVN